MTAEIVIMNREAIALASDSAVTSRMQSGQKIFASGNKLFALSYHHPVGIMVYNNAYFMELPWETIIKAYRKTVPKVGYDRLIDYFDSFVSFLEKSYTLFPADIRGFFVNNFIQSYLPSIRSDIETQAASVISETGKIDDCITEQIVEKVINEHIKNWEEVLVGSISIKKGEEIVERNEASFNVAVANVFQKLPLSEKSLAILFKLAVSVLSKGTRTEFNSGVVIAGFGEKEFFPSFIHFTVDGLVKDKLKFFGKTHSMVNYKVPSLIMPFAQSEMVFRFMEGVDPLYRDTEKGYLSELCNTYAKKVVENIPLDNADAKAKLKKELLQIGKTLAKDFTEKMDTFKREQFVYPITNLVSVLQKGDLARLAESLIALTYEKRQFSAEEETVKAPIDVAVITKGDGFIWIQRKHYFRQELNPQFFTTRNRRYENEKDAT